MIESKLEIEQSSLGSTSGTVEKSNYRWLVNWVVLLCSVFLFASALNCLFLWLSYGFTHDAAALAFSLSLALLVYFLALNPTRIASLQKRLLLSVSAMMIWSVFLPVIMRMAGFR